MRKRILSLLLCLVMSLSLLPTTGIVSAASSRGGDVILPPDTFPTSITKVELTVEAPTEGKLYSDSLMVPTLKTTPANAADVIVENLCWYNTDGSYFRGVFEADTVYAYEIYLKPKAGYCFDFNGDVYKGTVIANGSAPKYTECAGIAHDILEISVLVKCKPDNDLTITFDPNGGTGSMAPVTLSKGDIYTLPETCDFTAPEGMEFGGAWEVSCWETTRPAGTTWHYDQFEKATVIKPVWVKKDRAEITKVELSGLTAPVVGKTAAECSVAPAISTTPAAAAEYVVDSVRWFSSDWAYFDGTFAPGQTYFCEVCLRAAEDYKFSKDDDWNYTGEVMINGANEYAYAEPNAEGTLLYVCKGFTLEKEDITEIELTIGAPTVGKTAAECMLVPEFTTTPADAATLCMEDTAWYNYDGHGLFTGIFEAGKEYRYEVCLVAKDGYTFPGNGDFSGTTLVNGKEPLYVELGPQKNYVLIGIIMTPKAAGLPFTDVTEKDWSYKDIAYAYEKGLMNGTSETTFDPQVTTSRAMIVTILYRLEGSPVVNHALTFTDVEDDAWYTEAIRWAQSTGVVNGYTPTTFGPNDPITREQMAAIFYRYSEYKNYGTSARADLSKYADFGKVSAWALDSLSWANASGLINGVTASTLDPQGLATREQVAAILHRFCENIVK